MECDVWLTSSVSTADRAVEAFYDCSRNVVLVRNANDQTTPAKTLEFTLNEWLVFVDGVKSGNYDNS